MTEVLDKIYTAAEAAERLRLTNRALIKIARKSGHCSGARRDFLFSESDLLAIWQDMREPAVERRSAAPVTPLPSPLGIREELRWLIGPPISVDRRVIRIPQWFDKQKERKTYVQIDRCGPRTIEDLLRKGMVTESREGADDLARGTITSTGKDEARNYERWKRKREARQKTEKLR